MKQYLNLYNNSNQQSTKVDDKSGPLNNSFNELANIFKNILSQKPEVKLYDGKKFEAGLTNFFNASDGKKIDIMTLQPSRTCIELNIEAVNIFMKMYNGIYPNNKFKNPDECLKYIINKTNIFSNKLYGKLSFSCSEKGNFLLSRINSKGNSANITKSFNIINNLFVNILNQHYKLPVDKKSTQYIHLNVKKDKQNNASISVKNIDSKEDSIDVARLSNDKQEVTITKKGIDLYRTRTQLSPGITEEAIATIIVNKLKNHSYHISKDKDGEFNTPKKDKDGNYTISKVKDIEKIIKQANHLA